MSEKLCSQCRNSHLTLKSDVENISTCSVLSIYSNDFIANRHVRYITVFYTIIHMMCLKLLNLSKFITM